MVNTRPPGSLVSRWLVPFALALASLAISARGDDAPSAVPAVSDSAPAAAVAPPESDEPQFKIHPAGALRYDRGIRDSNGAIQHRPPPDSPEVPQFLVQADYLRAHHDEIGATDYLKLIVANGDLPAQYRAHAMLEIADSLEVQHQPAAALCWLKLWMIQFPTRLEAGAVAYRIGALYRSMGLNDLARDAYYLALAHSVNEGQVNNAEDLKQYTRLTVGTLWAMAANEYENAQWARAAQLFDRFQREAPSASPVSLENAAFLQADCYYQAHDNARALALYDETLKKHPFNPLAPQARLRAYHLDILAKQPEKAREELEALVWTVRTVWPAQEAYWQKRTAELLLALNTKNEQVLPPLVATSARLKPEGKSWQEAISHYDSLVGYQAAKHALMDQSDIVAPSGKPASPEEAELAEAGRELNQLLPPPGQDNNTP